jgi:hypothetical protein
MNKLMLPALAVTAVSLLSGCQVVTVRHYYPEPAPVIETRGPVHVVPPHRHQAPPPQVVIVRPAPPVRVVAPLPPRHPVPPNSGRRPEHAPEHPPVPRERNREPRRPPPAPKKVRVIPVTPQVKGGLFGATQQAVHKLQQGDKKPAPKNKPTKPKKEQKPQNKTPQKGSEERRRGN